MNIRFVPVFWNQKKKSSLEKQLKKLKIVGEVILLSELKRSSSLKLLRCRICLIHYNGKEHGKGGLEELR